MRIVFKPADILSLFDAHFTHEQGFVFLFGTDVTPIVSKQDAIYVLEGTSRQRYALRIPVHLSKKCNRDITHAVQRQVNLLRRLADSGFSWSPRLMAQSVEFDNHIGFPYVILGWMEGRSLKWDDKTPSERGVRNKLLWQMADIILELALCTQETRCGHTASSYTMELIDSQIIRTAQGKDSGVTLKDCIIQKALVHHALQGVPEISSFSLSHESLCASNIIVDDNYNVVGIVGWGFSRPLPIQFALRFPQFLTVDHDIDLANPDITDISSRDLLPISLTLHDDRLFFLTSVLTIVESQSPSADIRRWISFAFADPNAKWRHLIVESVLKPDVYSWMAKCGWLLDVTKELRPTKEDLIREVDGFEEFLEHSARNIKGPDRKTLLKAVGI